MTLATTLIVVGCSTERAPPPPVAVAPSAPVPIDGTYNGVMQLARGSADRCGTQDIFTLTVRDNAFRYVLNQPQVPYRPRRTFNVTIDPTGAFQAQDGTSYIRGTVSQGHMQGQLIGDACGYQFEADNTGSF